MEKIIKSLDLISNSQDFLKSNYNLLNKYWIEPRINKSITDTPDSQTQTTLNQIISHINLIDNQLEKIIIQILKSNIFDQVMETNAWVELEQLCMSTFERFNFIFGIPPEYTKPIVEFIDMDDNLTVAIQFIDEFKKIFGYKFLDLLDRIVLEKILLVLSHVKKLYLAHY